MMISHIVYTVIALVVVDAQRAGQRVGVGYALWSPVQNCQYNIPLQQQPQQQQPATSPSSGTEKFYDDMAQLVNALSNDMRPLNTEYTNLWQRFVTVMKDYAGKFAQRMNTAMVTPNESGGDPTQNGLAAFMTQDSIKNAEVQAAFARERIVPDLLSSAPMHVAEITFPQGIRVNLGENIFPIQTREPPTSFSWPVEAGALYTVIMTDPAPGGGGEWIHWLVTNVPGTDMRRGDTLVEYVPSAPPPGTGHHRYTFVVYKQSAPFSDVRLSYVNNRTVRGRGQFSTRIFAEQNRLGTPVAGNFYLAECDPFVPQVYAQLGQPNPGPCV